MSFDFPDIERDESTGLGYYHFPVGYPLYKATKRLDEHGTLTLKPNKLYFFGLKNEDPAYLEKYEKIYGIIFEFVTTKSFKLLALDDERTQQILHDSAPSNIQAILKKNYGYLHPKRLRDSVSESDRELSRYLCEHDYEGYAIKTMLTDLDGTFHPELMICNTHGKIKRVRKITTNPRESGILEKERMKKLEDERKAARAASKRKTHKLGSPSNSQEQIHQSTEYSLFPTSHINSLLLDTRYTTTTPTTTPTASPSRKKLHSSRTTTGGKKSKTRKNIRVRK